MSPEIRVNVDVKADLAAMIWAFARLLAVLGFFLI